MKFILLFLIAGLAAALLLPAQREGAATACDALNNRMRVMVEVEIAKLPTNGTAKAQAAVAAAKAQMPTGASIATLIQAKHPGLPPEPACAVAYWATFYLSDPRQWLVLMSAARP